MDSGRSSDSLDSSPGSVTCFAGWTLLAVFVATAALLGGISENVRLFQAAYAIGFAGYALIAVGLWRRPNQCRWVFWLAGAAALRLALLHVTPSDDLHRYLWEGRVQCAGFNPYARAPDDPALASLRDDDWRQINHRDYPAIYPPLAQLQFLAVAWVHPTLFGVKTLYVAFDMLAVVLIGLWLRELGKPPQLAMLYALNPLTLTAFGIEGHLDSAMIAAIAGAGVCHARGRHTGCGLLLGAAVLTKVVPILLLPWLAVKNLRAACLAVLLVVAGYLAYSGPQSQPFYSLIKFPRDTELLSLGYGVMHLASGGEMRIAGIDVGRGVCALAIVVVAIGCALKSGSLSSVLPAVFGGLIVFMPVVHYWYLTWIVLAFPFAPRLSWMVLTATMVFYFEAAQVAVATGVWSMPAWVAFAVYGPFLAAVVVERLLAPRARSA